MISGFEVLKLGELVFKSENNIEETMHLAVTKKELGMILFAMHFVHCLFPEMEDDIQELCKKVKEVAEAQDFLEFKDDE